MQDLWLKDKSIVIIGGTTGIGLSAAQAFIRHGANVLAIGRNPQSAEKASVQLKSALVETGDATEADTARKAIDRCIQHFGTFDGFIMLPAEADAGSVMDRFMRLRLKAGSIP